MERTLIVDQPNFRRYVTVMEKESDGAPQYFCECEELIDGRREGYVSIRTRLQYLEDRKLLKTMGLAQEEK